MATFLCCKTLFSSYHDICAVYAMDLTADAAKGYYSGGNVVVFFWFGLGFLKSNSEGEKRKVRVSDHSLFGVQLCQTSWFYNVKQDFIRNLYVVTVTSPDIVCCFLVLLKNSMKYENLLQVFIMSVRFTSVQLAL